MMQKLSLESKKEGATPDATKKVAFAGDSCLWMCCLCHPFCLFGGEVAKNYGPFCELQPAGMPYGSASAGDAQNAASPVDRSITPLLQEAVNANILYQTNGYGPSAYYYPTGTNT
jgi:hypothetical protein